MIDHSRNLEMSRMASLEAAVENIPLLKAKIAQLERALEDITAAYRLLEREKLAYQTELNEERHGKKVPSSMLNGL
jgi:hypothetical protein